MLAGNPDKEENENKKSSNLWKMIFWAVGPVIFIITCYAVFIIWRTWPISEWSMDKSGVFGDSFGFITALFTGLAFGGLIITILLQREELRLQRRELRQNREELRFQNFESTFFQMLRLHNEIVNSIDIRKKSSSKDQIATGRDCFLSFFKKIKKFYVTIESQGQGLEPLPLIEKTFQGFWNEQQQDLGHYFRYLYRIFKYIKERSFKDEYFYAGIARAQLSDFELAVIFYNCLSKNGSEKFKPLAEEYALFDNMPMKLILNKAHVDLYSKEAFGKNPGLQGEVAYGATDIDVVVKPSRFIPNDDGDEV